MMQRNCRDFEIYKSKNKDKVVIQDVVFISHKDHVVTAALSGGSVLVPGESITLYN